MWDLLGTLPAPRKRTPSRTAAGSARLKFRPRSMFTPLVARAVAASLIFAIAALGALSLFHSPVSEASSFMVSTQKDERHVAQFPDGSTVEMSGESAITVRTSEGQPENRLSRGCDVLRCPKQGATY